MRSVLPYGAHLWGPDAVVAVLAGGAHAWGGLSGCSERALQHPAVPLQSFCGRWWKKMVASKEVIHHAVFREELRQAHRAQINPGLCVYGGWGDRMIRMLAALGWEPIEYRRTLLAPSPQEPAALAIRAAGPCECAGGGAGEAAAAGLGGGCTAD